AVHALAHIKDGLVLGALASGMEVIFATHLRSSDGANLQQLRETRIDLVASRKGVKEGAGVVEFLLDVEFGVGIVRVFEVAVAIDDFVPLDGVLDRRDFGLRRTGPTGRSGGILGWGILRIDEGKHPDEQNQEKSQQTRTSQHKHLTPVVDEAPRIRLAEPWPDGRALSAASTAFGDLGSRNRHP